MTCLKFFNCWQYFRISSIELSGVCLRVLEKSRVLRTLAVVYTRLANRCNFTITVVQIAKKTK